MMFLDKLLQYALLTTFVLLSIFVHDSTSIIKRKFGLEYSNGGIFPDPASRYDVPDIPDTWRNLDSFKFDRSGLLLRLHTSFLCILQSIAIRH